MARAAIREGFLTLRTRLPMYVSAASLVKLDAAQEFVLLQSVYIIRVLAGTPMR